MTWTRDVFVFALMVGQSSGNVALRANIKLAYLLTYLHTYFLHGLESFLRS